MLGAPVIVPSFPAGSTTLTSGSYVYRSFYSDASCSSEYFIHQDATIANQCFPSYNASLGSFLKIFIAQDPAYAQNSLVYSIVVYYSDSSCSSATSAPANYSTNVDGACVHFTTAPYPSAPSSGYVKTGVLSQKPDSAEVSPTAGVFRA
jgi:hypothetical protein